MNNFNQFVRDKRPSLIIDDCTVYRAAVKGMLQKMGFAAGSILTAADAQSAELAAKNNNLKLIFCDYNLDKSANGTQLLNKLRSNQLISSSCVLVIITGDSSHGVVSGFAELEPDGYIIKPLNYVTLSERLPKWCAKKQLFKDALTLFDDHQYEAVITQLEELNFKTPKFNDEITYIKGKAYARLLQFDTAEAVLSSLKKSTLQRKALLALVDIYILKKDYTAAKETLDEILVEHPRCPTTTQRYAEFALQLKSPSLAMEMIDLSINLSPNNIEKYFLKYYIGLVINDSNTALDTLQLIQSLAKKSMYDSIDLAFMKLGLLVDLLRQTISKGGIDRILVLVKEELISLRRSYAKSSFVRYELLIKTRISLIIEQRAVALEYYTQYEELTEDTEDIAFNLLEAIEKIKIESCLKAELLVRRQVEQLSDSLDNEVLKHCSYIKYLEQCVAKEFAFRKRLATLLSKIDVDIQLKSYDTALNSAMAAFNQSPNNDKVATYMLFILTKAWPLGQSKQQIQVFIEQSKRVIEKNTGILDEESAVHYDVLAKKLDMNQFV